MGRLARVPTCKVSALGNFRFVSCKDLATLSNDLTGRDVLCNCEGCIANEAEAVLEARPRPA